MAQGQTDMNDRTCIVSGKPGDPDTMIRFVAGPDGVVVPDVAHKLPGRGCWVTNDRAMVEQAVAKKLFARGLKAKVSSDENLAQMTDQLLARDALRAFAMARKAGQLVSGAMQVDKAVRNGQALAVLASTEAAPDGVRKIMQARKATVYLGGPNIPAFQLFGRQEMDLAFGDGNVIHAAIMQGGAGNAALRRTVRLDQYRGGSGQQLAIADDEINSAFADEETDEV